MTVILAPDFYLSFGGIPWVYGPLILVSSFEQYLIQAPLSAAISKCPPGSIFDNLLILTLLLKWAKNCRCSLFVVGHYSIYAIKYRQCTVSYLIAPSKSAPK